MALRSRREQAADAAAGFGESSDGDGSTRSGRRIGEGMGGVETAKGSGMREDSCGDCASSQQSGSVAELASWAAGSDPSSGTVPLSVHWRTILTKPFLSEPAGGSFSAIFSKLSLSFPKLSLIIFSRL